MKISLGPMEEDCSVSQISRKMAKCRKHVNLCRLKLLSYTYPTWWRDNIDFHENNTKHALNEIVLEFREVSVKLVIDLRMNMTTLAQQCLQLFVWVQWVFT